VFPGRRKRCVRIVHLGVGADFHWKGARGRRMTQLGLCGDGAATIGLGIPLAIFDRNQHLRRSPSTRGNASSTALP
jgi:hypothetical protein